MKKTGHPIFSYFCMCVCELQCGKKQGTQNEKKEKQQQTPIKNH